MALLLPVSACIANSRCVTWCTRGASFRVVVRTRVYVTCSNKEKTRVLMALVLQNRRPLFIRLDAELLESHGGGASLTTQQRRLVRHDKP